MYYLKKESADGRLLIWKLCTRVIARHPLGVGLGNFSGSYGKQQFAYFASSEGTAQEIYVAGNPDYAFNEYLQTCIEYGIPCFLLFFVGVCRAIYTGIRMKRHAVVGSLGALLIFAFMSYPFNVLPFVIVFMFLLASCAKDIKPVIHEKTAGKYVTVIYFGFLLTLTIACSYSRISTYHAYNKLNTSSILKINGLRNDALHLYTEIYDDLNQEIHFVFDYANMLKNEGRYTISNQVLQKGMKISCDPVLYILTGLNYQQIKEYTAAETYFRKAADLVPNRLYPYYLLANLYLEMGLSDKACIMAKIVLTKEPKVHSQAIVEMREEMKEICTE